MIQIKTDNSVVVYCKTTAEMEDIVEDLEFIFPQITRGIESLINESVESKKIFSIWCSETLSIIEIWTYLDSASDTLLKILEWRESREEYEECSTIRDLMKKIDERITELESADPLDLLDLQFDQKIAANSEDSI